jgi:hypothetical protein
MLPNVAQVVLQTFEATASARHTRFTFDQMERRVRYRLHLYNELNWIIPGAILHKRAIQVLAIASRSGCRIIATNATSVTFFRAECCPRRRCSNRSASGSAFPSFANAFSGKIMPRHSQSGEAVSARHDQT